MRHGNFLIGHLRFHTDNSVVRCGPCHAIAPTFEALSRQYENVNFLKCDVEAARDVASIYRVSAMSVIFVPVWYWTNELKNASLLRPTFVFLKGSTKVDQVRGANKA